MFRNSYTSKNLNITHKNLMNRNHFCGRFLNFWTKCFEPLKFVHLLVVSKTTQSTPVGGLKSYPKYTCSWSQKLLKLHLLVVSKSTQSTSVGGLKSFPGYQNLITFFRISDLNTFRSKFIVCRLAEIGSQHMLKPTPYHTLK